MGSANVCIPIYTFLKLLCTGHYKALKDIVPGLKAQGFVAKTEKVRH